MRRVDRSLEEGRAYQDQKRFSAQPFSTRSGGAAHRLGATQSPYYVVLASTGADVHRECLSQDYNVFCRGGNSQNRELVKPA